MFVRRSSSRNFLFVLACLLQGFALLAQNDVTPIVQTTPTGTLTTVAAPTAGVNMNDPHISGNLACYTQINNDAFTVQYFNLATGAGTQVPNPNTAQNMDFLCDVRGSVITFTRVTDATQACAAICTEIWTFDTSVSGGQPVQLTPDTIYAQESRIGDQTIIWQQNNSTVVGAYDIIAYNRSTGASQQLDPSPITGTVNQELNISPNGTVAVWVNCPVGDSVDCNIWEATLANGSWTAQQLTSSGTSSHPATDGNIVTWSCLCSGVQSVYWQPVGGGTEEILNAGGSELNPSASSGYIAFDWLLAGGSNLNLAVYNASNNDLYDVTSDLVAAGLYAAGQDANLPDISVTNGQLTAVWQVGVPGTTIYAYSFNIGAPVYIANAGSNSVSVINPSTNAVADTIAVGSTPVDVAISPSGSTAYVVNAGSSSVSVINTATQTVAATITVGLAPAHVAATPNGAEAYVTNVGSNSVSVINTSTNAIVATIPVGYGPTGVAITPNGSTLYVLNTLSGSVSVVSTSTNSVIANVRVGALPSSVAITANGALAYVVNSGSNSVSVINTSTNAVVGTVKVGVLPLDVAITPNGGTAYVANSGSKSVSVFSCTSLPCTGATTVSVGSLPSHVVISADGTTAYVTNAGSSSVSVINTASNTVATTVTVGTAPLTAAIDGGNVYVLNALSSSVSAINASSNSVAATISVGSDPVAIGVQ